MYKYSYNIKGSLYSDFLFVFVGVSLVVRELYGEWIFGIVGVLFIGSGLFS